MKSILFVLVFLATFSGACSKNDGSGTSNVAPSNLNLTSVVSTDSSGNVSFTATATNAVNYVYSFGDNGGLTTATGKTDYKYQFTGTYTVKVTATSASGKTTSTTAIVNIGVALTLVWSDEFDTPGVPDPLKWGYDLGGGGWGNNELEYYTNRPENVIVSNGTLKITALKESYNGNAYTSARMITNGLYGFKYGKIETRAKLPAAAGTWPAIWMLGGNIATAGWPACGEIDIMEQNGTQKSLIYGTMHYPSQVGQYGDGSSTSITNPSTTFHVYTALWTPSKIELSIDGNVFYTLANKPAYPFNQNFFIILNMAMGGNFGGPVDPAFTSDQMEVDYVRVYQ